MKRYPFKRLTVTKVVFELACDKPPKALAIGLTVTKVVFELQ